MTRFMHQSTRMHDTSDHSCPATKLHMSTYVGRPHSSKTLTAARRCGATRFDTSTYHYLHHIVLQPKGPYSGRKFACMREDSEGNEEESQSGPTHRSRRFFGIHYAEFNDREQLAAINLLTLAALTVAACAGFGF